MRIEFDPTNPTEAAAVRAMLTAMHPTAPRYDPTAQPATLIFEEKVHSEDGGMTVNLTDSTITVASEHNEETNPKGVDENGEPWDARIHSTPAKTNADGTWRAKRGVTAEQVAAVRSEREASQTTQAIDPRELEANGVHPDDMNDPVYEYTPDPTMEAPKVPLEESAPATPPAPPVSEPSNTHTAAPTPPAPTAPAGSSGEYSFLDVMKAITAAQKAGKVDTAKVKELCAAIGAGDSTMGLNGADKGELRVQFMALLDGECAA